MRRPCVVRDSLQLVDYRRYLCHMVSVELRPWGELPRVGPYCDCD